MTSGSGVGNMAALVAGTISFLSPCVLPLVPAYLSYIAGEAIDEERERSHRTRLFTLALSAAFVLGFSLVFISLGASATAIGRVLLQHKEQANIAAGIIIIIFGVLMLGGARWFKLLQRDFRFHVERVAGNPLTAFVLGVAFAFGWTPCIGPILGAILTVSAASATVAEGVRLLAVYSLGLGLPFLLVAVFTGGLFARLKSIGRIGRALQVVAGGIMVVMGAAMMTDQLSTFSFWLLETFPKLSTIG